MGTNMNLPKWLVAKKKEIIRKLSRRKAIQRKLSRSLSKRKLSTRELPEERKLSVPITVRESSTDPPANTNATMSPLEKLSINPECTHNESCEKLFMTPSRLHRVLEIVKYTSGFEIEFTPTNANRILELISKVVMKDIGKQVVWSENNERISL